MTRHIRPIEHFQHLASIKLKHIWPEYLYNYLLPIVTEDQLRDLDDARSIKKTVADKDQAIIDWSKEIRITALWNTWQIIELNDLWLVRTDIYQQFKPELLDALAELDIETDYYLSEK